MGEGLKRVAKQSGGLKVTDGHGNSASYDGDGELTRYEHKCPHCGIIHHRGGWSIAHIREDQTFKCECGNLINVPAITT